MKKLTALLLAVIILILPSCAEESPAALTYGETVITEAMYNYYVSTYKARYIQSYSDISDTDEFWEKDMDGKTGEEIISDLIYENVAQNLVAAELYRKEGLTLSADETKEIDDYIQSMIDELASGSRQTFNGYLAEFGVNMDILREMFIMERSAYLYYEHLYGENGDKGITDEDKDKYLEDNFVCFQQIYINNIDHYVTDKDGKYIQDENGEYQKRELTDEEKAEVESRIAAVKEGLESGENFDTLKEKYSDSKDYPKGYYFSAATSTNYITPVVSAAFKLNEGEWTYVEGAKENGAFFIKRLPLAEKAYADKDLADFFSTFNTDLTSEIYIAMLKEKYGDITKNEKFLNDISVKNSPVNYYYY